jgi:hypothetical protein
MNKKNFLKKREIIDFPKKQLKLFNRKSKKKNVRGGSINPFVGININSEISVPYNVTSIMQNFSILEKNAQMIKILVDYNKEITLLSGLFSLCVVGYIVKQKIDNNILSKELTQSKKTTKAYKKSLLNSKKAIIQIRNELKELKELNALINSNISPYIPSLYGILRPLTQMNVTDDCKLTEEQKTNKCICYKN